MTAITSKAGNLDNKFSDNIRKSLEQSANYASSLGDNIPNLNSLSKEQFETSFGKYFMTVRRPTLVSYSTAQSFSKIQIL